MAALLYASAALLLAHIIAEVNCMPSQDDRTPFYIGCTKSDDCGKGECCVIGWGRFSIPECRPHLSRGEQCQPDRQSGFEAELSYPDGVSVYFKDIYHECPCGFGLRCDNTTAKCLGHHVHDGFNSLDYAETIFYENF